MVVIIGITLFFTQKERVLLLPTVPEPKQDALLEPKDELEKEEVLPVSVILENLTIPWDLGFLPDGSMLVTERPGRLLHFDSETKKIDKIEISNTRHIGEGGLLGLAVHPNFSENNLIYLYITREAENGFKNEVRRYKFSNNQLTDQKIILANIPGARYHDGGRIQFSPSPINGISGPYYLYITVGDAGDENSAQNKNSLAGKILRIKEDGKIPINNPFGNTVYSYGHRNPQGLSWDDEGNLWSTEHGRSGILSGFDELNLIEVGKNYGWPDSQGDTVLSETVAPTLHSGADDTWAPASALYWDGSIFFGGLRGEALYEAKLSGVEIVELKEYFKNEFGRIRTIRLGPDNMFYITTSNQDGRGTAKIGDDKIIRLDPEKLFR